MATMEFGVFDEFGCNYFRSIPEAVDHYEQTFREVELEESLGYQYHFVVEHQGNNVGQCQSPAVYLAALAQRTSTIRIGGMIFLTPFHNPMRLAQDAAMLDQLSRGRLEFGVGAGVFEHEFRRWKLPFAERRAMARESMEIVEKAWTQESVTHDGKYWKFDEAIPLPRPYQKPHPPIWFAGRTDESLQYAAEHNYGIGMFLEPDPKAAERFEFWRGLWKQAGHKGPMPRTFITRSVYVAETDEQAREEAAAYLVKAYTYGDERIKRAPVETPEDSPYIVDQGAEVTYTRRLGAEMFQGMTTGIDFWLEHGLAHVGSPETVIRRLEESQKLMGFDIFGGSFRWGGMPDELVMKSIRLFGEKVMPAFSRVPAASASV